MKFLSRLLGGSRTPELASEVRSLALRLTELEDTQLRREIEWRETKDQIKRHLGRAAALSAKKTEPEVAPQIVAALRAKFPHTNGG